ncbi:MAG: GGDEF domain-containing protein [Tenericutes bacterium]|nr:GGDEF domain-containing protein [Mycoplasmatota bacterium]
MSQLNHLSEIAYVDSLTKINNRYALFHRLESLVQINQEFKLIFMDLNDLKSVNDNYGHHIGDEYLKEFARALKLAFKSKGDVFRFAGDEFICISLDTNLDTDTIQKDIGKNFKFESKFNGFSFGCALYPEDGLRFKEIIKLADKRMYQNKNFNTIR